MNREEIIERRREFRIPGYKTLAEVGFDGHGKWVTPYQITSRSMNTNAMTAAIANVAARSRCPLPPDCLRMFIFLLSGITPCSAEPLVRRGGMPSPTIYMYVVAASKARQCRFPGAAMQKTKGSGVLGGVPRRRIVRVLRRRISNRQQEAAKP